MLHNHNKKRSVEKNSPLYVLRLYVPVHHSSLVQIGQSCEHHSPHGTQRRPDHAVRIELHELSQIGVHELENQMQIAAFARHEAVDVHQLNDIFVRHLMQVTNLPERRGRNALVVFRRKRDAWSAFKKFIYAQRFYALLGLIVCCCQAAASDDWLSRSGFPDAGG